MGDMLPVTFDRPLPLARVVEVADAMRAAALAQLPDGAHAPMLSGRDQQGRLGGQHQHVHWLPVVSDARTLTGLAAWCPGGLSAPEAAAIGRVRRLWTRRWRRDVGPGTAPAWPMIDGWCASLTPFAPGRHHVSLGDEIARECALRGLPAPAETRRLPTVQRFVSRRPSQVMVRRPAPPVMVAVRFPEPVPGPVALGRMCHFGLGVFWPIDPARLP